MMTVKAAILIDYVRIIRAHRDRAWHRYLMPEDFEIVNSRVFTGNIYPYESYRRIARAVFALVGNSDLEVARGFGSFNMRNMLAIYHESILVKGDPAGSIARLARLSRVFIQGGWDSMVAAYGPDWATYLIDIPPDETDMRLVEAFAYHMMGKIEEVIRQSGGKYPVTSLVMKPHFIEIKIKWAMPDLAVEERPSSAPADKRPQPETLAHHRR